MSFPGYWMNETSGVLKPAVEAYLKHQPMSREQIAALRAYLRQWMDGDWADTPAVAALRADVDQLTTRAAIDAWMERALDEAIDPL
jgi:hypothetical protein